MLSCQVLCECSLSLGKDEPTQHKEVKNHMPSLMGYDSGSKLLIRLQNIPLYVICEASHASPTVTIETLWIPDAVLCSTFFH